MLYPFVLASKNKAGNMETNVSNLDRAARLAIGSLMFWLGWNSPEATQLAPWLFYVAGFPTLMTGILGHCPFYKLLGISTCPGR